MGQQKDLKSKCLIVGHESGRIKIRTVIGQRYRLIDSTPNEPAILDQHIDASCIIIGFTMSHSETLLRFARVCKDNYSSIPVIVIMFDQDLDVARQLGRLNVYAILPTFKIAELAVFLEELAGRHQKVLLADFDIDVQQFPYSLMRALRFIEENYVQLMGTGEVARYLGITESSLARKFKESNIINPKRLLMMFKVRHALRLMDNHNVTLKRITYLAGFSNEKRFNECFHRMFNCGPDEYRNFILKERLK